MRFTLIMTIFLLSCTHVPEDSLLQHKTAQCDKIFKDHLSSEDLKIHKKILNGVGHLTSYTLTGIGYTGDLIIFLASGVAVPVVICSPLYPLLQVGGSAGEIVIRCWGNIGSSSYKYIKKNIGGYAGENIYEATQSMRCSDYSWLNTALMDVANCYKDIGELELYAKQLKRIEESSANNKCL